jgi:excisionase family DNA binding protein
MKRFSDYMMIKEAAEFLGVTAVTLRNWEKDNKVKVYRSEQNNYRLYCKEDLEQMLENIRYQK